MPDPAPSSVNLASTGTTLLGPDDPPPFEILHPAGRAPLLIICDHASRAMPRALGKRGLGDPTSIPEESDGVRVPGNVGPTPAARVARVDGIFRPYHAAIEAQLA